MMRQTSSHRAGDIVRQNRASVKVLRRDSVQNDQKPERGPELGLKEGGRKEWVGRVWWAMVLSCFERL